MADPVTEVNESVAGAFGVGGVNVYFVPLAIAAVFALLATPYATVGDALAVTLAKIEGELPNPIDAPPFVVLSAVPEP
jgi:hypothetical protein